MKFSRRYTLLILIFSLFTAACAGKNGSGSGVLPHSERSIKSISTIVVKHVYSKAAGNTEDAIVSLSPSPIAGDTEVGIIEAANTGGKCYSLTVPTGWSTPQGTCIGRYTIWVSTHTAGSGDTSYSFKLSGYDYMSVTIYDVSGANSVTPIDVGPTDQAFTSGTQQTTATLTPTSNGDLAIGLLPMTTCKIPL